MVEPPGLFRRVVKALVPLRVRTKVRLALGRINWWFTASLLGVARLAGIGGSEKIPFTAPVPRARPANYRYLHERNVQAMRALNDVDIRGCIEAAIPGATLSCSDEEIEKLHIKEAACHYLAVALLQGLGRLDEAIYWWRERRRIFSALARHYVRRDRVEHDPEHLIFDDFWTSHIGHTAMLGLYVKRNLLEGRPYRRLSLLRKPEPNPGNRCLVDHWQPYFRLADHVLELSISPDYSHYLAKNIFIDERLTGPETYFWQVYAEISRAWEEAKGGSLLELSKEEQRRGEETLAAMGIPRGAWYVCLHVRSSGFKSTHEGLHDTLNAAIASYDLAIDAIVRRGGWVIRMGNTSMPPLPERHGVVDYAHGQHRSDWMDVFLCATCRFYVGTSSGLAYVPNLFSTPCVFTNWFPTGTRPLNGTDIFIPKMHRYDRRDEFAPFAESLAPPLGHIHDKSGLTALGVSLSENSREDLRDVVDEMLDRLEGTPAYTPEDDALRARFDAVAMSARSFGNAQIGRDFIRKYRGLLPNGAA